VRGDEQFVLLGRTQVCATGGERCAEPGEVRRCQTVQAFVGCQAKFKRDTLKDINDFVFLPHPLGDNQRGIYFWWCVSVCLPSSCNCAELVMPSGGCSWTRTKMLHFASLVFVAVCHAPFPCVTWGIQGVKAFCQNTVPFDMFDCPTYTMPTLLSDVWQFLSCVRTLTRDIDIAIMSVCLSVRDVPVSDENGLTYRHRFFTIR